MRGCVASTTTTSRPLMAISAAGHQRVPTGPNRPGWPASVAFANAPFTSFSFSFSSPRARFQPSPYHARLRFPLFLPVPFVPSPSPSLFATPSPLVPRYLIPFHLRFIPFHVVSRRLLTLSATTFLQAATCRVIPMVPSGRNEVPRLRRLSASAVRRPLLDNQSTLSATRRGANESLFSGVFCKPAIEPLSHDDQGSSSEIGHPCSLPYTLKCV